MEGEKKVRLIPEKKKKRKGSIAGNFKPSGFQFVTGFDVEHAQTTPSSIFVYAGGAETFYSSALMKL